MVRKQDARVRLFARRGFDWSHRFPAIVEAGGKLRVSSISLDGEAVVCGDDGVSDSIILRTTGPCPFTDHREDAADLQHT